MFIDGVSIGTFSSDASANVCVSTSVPLANGAHVLTGNELSPISTNVVTPFNFSVDTVVPPTTSTPVLGYTSDTGVKGDNITSLHGFTISGTSATGAGVTGINVYYANGSRYFGGAVPNNGSWSVGNSVSGDGVYALQAVAIDEAGNQSPLSGALTVTVDSVPPTTALTAPAPGATVSGVVNVTANASDNVAMWKVAFQVDGVTMATDTAGPYSYSLDTTTLGNGSHTITALATDAAGNTASSSETVTVQNGGATVPGAPTLNSAAPGNGSVTLGWSAPGSNGGAAVSGYDVYRGSSSGSETLLAMLGNVTVWTDTAAANGATYYYKLSAVNSVGEGSKSNELNASPSAPATVPGAPTLNTAAAGNATVTLGWSAPSNNGGATITSYKVYRGTSSGNETFLTTLGNVTSYTDTGLTNGSTYYYKVTAVNSVGEGAKSNEMNATPAAAATVPGTPTLNSATPGNASVVLGWSAPASNGGSAVTGYKVYRGTSSGNETFLTTLGNVTSYTDSGVTNGSTYYYKVSALNSVGEGSKSNEMSATPSVPATVPGAPTMNTATAGNGTVTLAWSAPSINGGASVTGYKLYRGTSSGSETLLTTLGTVTSYTDTGVSKNGTIYYYKVTAVNSVGEGAKSNEVSAIPGHGQGHQ
jgi:fibronectin type 3 domain-containing protein